MLCRFHHNYKRNKASVSLWEKSWAHLLAAPGKMGNFLHSGFLVWHNPVGCASSTCVCNALLPWLHGDLWEQEAHAASCAETSCLNSPGLASFLEESMEVWEADPEDASCFQAPRKASLPLTNVDQHSKLSVRSKGAVCPSNEHAIEHSSHILCMLSPCNAKNIRGQNKCQILSDLVTSTPREYRSKSRLPKNLIRLLTGKDNKGRPSVLHFELSGASMDTIHVKKSADSKCKNSSSGTFKIYTLDCMNVISR